MAKTKLQEFVLSFRRERMSKSEILIVINNMDEARQVIEMMNKIGMCRNYSSWISKEESGGLVGFKRNKATHLLICIHNETVTYSGSKEVSELTGEKLAYINAKDYTVRRERKKLTL